MTLKELLAGDEYLYKAFLKSKKNRKYKLSALHFENNLFVNLNKIREELLDGSYKMSKYTYFKVYEPKEREVLSCSFRDKVVQHLICDNIIVPKFETLCILDNYAAQKGKGSSLAISRTRDIFQEFYEENGMNGWIYRADISKYYYSINHDVAKIIMHDYFYDNKDVIWLIDMFIDSTDRIKIDSYTKGTGLALGNQINTVISNLYLSKLDVYVKDILCCEYYGRYADDFYIITKTKDEIKNVEKKIEEFMEIMYLKLNHKTQIMPFKNGIKIIGFHFKIRNGELIVTLDNNKKRAYRRKFNRLFRLVKSGDRDISVLLNSYESWRSHANNVTDNNIFFYYENKMKELI